MTVELWVDFNNTDGAGNVVTPRKFATTDHFPGEKVIVGDGEGDECDATVVAVDDDFILVSLTPGSFRHEDSDHRAHAPA